MKKQKKRITDKDRLDWLNRWAKRKGLAFSWGTDVKRGVRAAIDAAIRAERGSK